MSKKAPPPPSINQQVVMLPITDIAVDWEHRYRYGDFSAEKRDEIASSLLSTEKGGLLYPIIVDSALKLRVGGHRLSAFLTLSKAQTPCPFPAYDNWRLIPCFVGHGFSEANWDAIEKAENFLRREIAWFPRAKMIHEFHTARLAEDHKWSIPQTAACLSLSPEPVNWSVAIMALYHSADPADLQAAAAIQKAGTFRTAYEIARRRQERVAEAEREAVRVSTRKAPAVSTSPAPSPAPSDAAQPAAAPALPAECPILHTSLRAFTAAYTGPRFNLIHTDPPYGIDRHLENGQSSRHDVLKYDDSTDTFWTYLADLSEFLARHAADSAHLIIWLPTDLFRLKAVMDQLLDTFPGWTLDPTPFIWTRADSAGIAPAPSYSGRRNYEWALLLSSGNRKIVQVKDLSLTCPYGRGERIHISEKPFPLIRHLCSMFVDSTTVAIDPTAGSGRPLQAIHSLGAGSVLGLEQDADIHLEATKDWQRYIAVNSPSHML